MKDDLVARKPPQGGSGTADWLDIVGHCPKCGAPIYGQKYLPVDAPTTVKHACQCNPRLVESPAGKGPSGLWHFSAVPGAAICGAADKNMGTTTILDHVTCADCLERATSI